MQALSRITRTLFTILPAFLAGSVLAQDLRLPAPNKTGGMPLMEALAKRATAREFDTRELAPQQLSSLLWACFGISRPDGKRTAPSAKNNQETDIYVILKQGAYLYDAKANALKLALKADLRSLAGTQDFATNAPVTLVFVADQAKMGKWTPEEKRNYAYIDAGYISQNAYLFCASEGLVTGARASVDRKALAAKLELRPDQLVVLAQSIGYPKP
jgi:nitroreductase